MVGIHDLYSLFQVVKPMRAGLFTYKKIIVFLVCIFFLLLPTGLAAAVSSDDNEEDSYDTDVADLLSGREKNGRNAPSSDNIENDSGSDSSDDELDDDLDGDLDDELEDDLEDDESSEDDSNSDDAEADSTGEDDSSEDNNGSGNEDDLEDDDAGPDDMEEDLLDDESSSEDDNGSDGNEEDSSSEENNDSDDVSSENGNGSDDNEGDNSSDEVTGSDDVGEDNTEEDNSSEDTSSDEVEQDNDSTQSAEIGDDANDTENENVSNDENNDTDSTSSDSTSDTSSSSSSSSSGSSGSSSSGMLGQTRENYDNIEFTDLSFESVVSGKETVFEFTEEKISIISISFIPRLSGGQVKTIVESLKETSDFAEGVPPGKVYKNLNVWIGTGQYAPYKLTDAKVSFKVEKQWLDSNDVGYDNIVLYNYHEEWISLDTEKTDEDETYVYYTAQTPGFSMFAISTGEDSSLKHPAEEDNLSEENESLFKDGGDTSGSTADTSGGSSISYGLLLMGLGVFVLWAIGFVVIRNRMSLDEIGPQLRNQGEEVFKRLKR